MFSYYKCWLCQLVFLPRGFLFIRKHKTRRDQENQLQAKEIEMLSAIDLKSDGGILKEMNDPGIFIS